MTVAFLALGSNLGDRAATLDAAEAAIAALASTMVATASTRHETPALLPSGAPAAWDIPFLNAVLMVRTDLAPRELLEATQGIETALGRQPAARWAPRIIDIDILSHGTAVIDTPSLTLPHPEIANRLFVLAPWRELDPRWRHPLTGRTVDEMHDALAPAP